MATSDSASPINRSAPTLDTLPAAPGAHNVRRDVMLATLFAVLAVTVVAGTWLAPVAALDVAAAAVGWLRMHNDVPGRAALTVVVIAVAALVWVSVWARATAPQRPVRVAGGRGTIPVDEIAAWLSAQLETRADVRDATVSVQHHGKGVRVAARMAVTPDARLDDTTDGARAIIEQVLASQVGAPLVSAPAIELRYEELRLRRRRGVADSS
jgi:hypothetical protein